MDRHGVEQGNVKYLLDSNIIIAAIIASSSVLRDRLGMCDEDDIVTSAIVYAEVAHGSRHGKPPPLDLLGAFLQDIPVLPFDEAAGVAYASLPFLRASYDRLIAAHALSRGLTVVTQNVRHFADVPSLPNGYFGMFLLAYFPALFFRVMNPRLLKAVGNDASRINFQPGKKDALVSRYALRLS